MENKILVKTSVKASDMGENRGAAIDKNKWNVTERSQGKSLWERNVQKGTPIKYILISLEV